MSVYTAAQRLPPQVVAVGLTTLDVIQRITGSIVIGGKVFSTGVEAVAGGPAANAAITAAALLGSAELVSALGFGPGADACDADLSLHGVHVLDCAPVNGWSIPISSCVVADNGERTVVAPGARHTSLDLSDEAIRALQAADVLLLDGHHPTLAEQALDVVRPECITVLDAGSVKPRVETWLPRLDVLAASADYAAELGLTPEEACAHGLAAGCGAALVTQGAGPVVWQRADRPLHQTPVRTVTVRDTLGAGDAFHGALAAALGLAAQRSEVRLAGFARVVASAAEVATRRVETAGARSWLSTLELARE